MNVSKRILFAASLAGVLALSTGRAAALKIPEVPRDKVICFALYTVQNNILKLTAQLYPLNAEEDRRVRLEIRKSGKRDPIAQTQVAENGWLACFRIENWDR